jgi:hypothetical protein
VFLMSMVTNSTGFIIVRCCIGFSLACFVCCQFWCAPTGQLAIMPSSAHTSK